MGFDEVASHPVPDALQVRGQYQCRPARVAAHLVRDGVRVRVRVRARARARAREREREVNAQADLDVAADLVPRRAMVGHCRGELAGVLPQPDLLTSGCLDHVLRRVAVQLSKARPDGVSSSRRRRPGSSRLVQGSSAVWHTSRFLGS